MLLARENGSLKVYSSTYQLEFAQDRPFVYLKDAAGSRIAELFVLASIHPLNGRDDTTQVGAWHAEEGLNHITLCLETASSAWKSKTIRLRCMPNRFTYEVEVEVEEHAQGNRGSSASAKPSASAVSLAEAIYFGGYSSASLRWGSGFFWSGQSFQQGFNPEPDCAEIYTFPPECSSSINLTGVPLPGRDDWFFTPPPFCYAFETAPASQSHSQSSVWLSLSVEARPGENRYCDYRYHGSRGAFHLSLDFEGHTPIQARYLLPAIAFDFGPDPYTLLAAHVQHLRAGGLAPTPAGSYRPDWWSEPIFCGWGAQSHLANISGGRAPDYATQASYEAFLHTLSDHGICPGTIVIDDKWQTNYGENQLDPDRWPDLPGFIHSRHENGQRVLLWLKAWDPQGIPANECITNAAGLPLAVDPTNPAFERRLRQSIRRMLSFDGYGADGFKIDFSARIPSGPGIQTYASATNPVGGAWGLELMRLYLGIIHDEARRVKADALIITHTPHPYLADLVDAVRLNDINTCTDVTRQMTHRARVAAIACPEALIDMDNWPMRDKASWREYLALKPALGIPALYFASHIDSTGEALTEEDYCLLRTAWADYRATLAAHRRQPADRQTADTKINEPGGVLRSPHIRTITSTQPVIVKPLKAAGNKGFGG
jgi:hypothetical protein